MRASATWDQSFTAQIGVLVREVEEEFFAGFIRLDWNTIEICGSPPLIIIESIDSILETSLTAVILLTISRAPRGTGAIAMLSSGKEAGIEEVILIYSEDKVLPTIRSALITACDEYSTVLDEDLPEVYRTRTVPNVKTYFIQDFDQSLN